MEQMSPIPRPYHSPVREERAASTHRRIVEAARRLFVEQGYASTTVAQIAREAGVSPQTIYNSIGGKGALLLALNDLVDEVAQVRPIQARIAVSDDPREIVRLTVGLRRQMMGGAGDIVVVLMGAAGDDPEVAKVYANGQARSRTGTRRIVERLESLGALRDDLDLDTAADALYALLHHVIWSRLVDECGWSPDQFEEWCTDLLTRTLLRDGV
jgi:AcrR family transcriptional regulator